MAKGPIDPFARRMLQGTAVYGGVMLAMFAVLTAVYLHTHPRCTDRLIAQAAGPDRRWIAVVMERRCGDEAPFFTHVNLRSAAEDLQRGLFSGSAEKGEVFRIEMDAASAGLALQWTGSNRLTVRCPRCSTSLLQKRDSQWGEVSVDYQLPAP